MKFDINKSIEILKRTPAVMDYMLRDISYDWANNNEGPNTWSPYDVLGHLIHGESTDWIARMEKILSNDPHNKSFDPFNRFAQFEESKGKTLEQLLDEFRLLRNKNLEILKSKNLTVVELNMTGLHPKFGMVTLSQLLSAWVVHDLDHIYQISRVMAKQYKEEVGPWVEFMRILKNQ